MKKHIKETEHGIHIDNAAWDEIEDEAEGGTEDEGKDRTR